MTDLKEINPQGVYSFAEAVKLIPSCHEGKTLHLATLYRWRIAGRVKAHRLPGRGWAMFGSEILKLLHANECPEWVSRTPAQRRHASEAAMAELRRMGVRLWGS